MSASIDTVFTESEGSPEIDAAWKREALDRCKAFDEGRLTEREATDVLRDAYRKAK
jgi:hypothetical protein